MKKRQVVVIGLTLVVVFGVAAAAFQWGLADIAPIEAMDEIDMGLEPGPMTRAVRERVARLEAIPASVILAPARMEELRSGLAGLEQALEEIQAASTEAAQKSKTERFGSLLIPVKVDLEMTAEGIGLIRSLYRLVFLVLFVAGVVTAIGWPGIATLIILVAAFASAVGLFLDTHLGYPVFALSFLLLALLFGVSLSRLPADNMLVARTEQRLALTNEAGKRRIFRRDILIGLSSLVLGAALSVVMSLLLPVVSVVFIGLMAYGILKFGISFGVWLRHRSHA